MNVSSKYDNLEDGGNTEALKTEVEMSWPQDMWELRAELLGKSPHLSKEVLLTAADKTEVLPESVLFEILSANPDELNDKELMDYLANKQEPLPQYLISILQQVSNSTTYKTVLLNEMAEYHATKSRAALDMIRCIAHDTVFDAVAYRNWLDNLGGLNADKQIIASYINEGDFASAQSMLDILPVLYQLEGDYLNNYNDYKQLTLWQISLLQQGRSIMELNSDEINMLETYAGLDNNAGSIAQGILEFGYGYNYCDCLPQNDSSVWKNSSVFPVNYRNDRGMIIEAAPNPARNWVVFNYSLPANSNEAILEIRDVRGNQVALFEIKQGTEQMVWDIRQMKPGLYIYTLISYGRNESGKLVIDQ